jgi:putative membrane protein
MNIDDYFEWYKVLHILGFTSWMAGMFYLPRLFVYHTEAKPGNEDYKRFLTMERRLLKIIMNPAMIATLVFGGLLSYVYGLSALGPWFHVKLFCVFLMCTLHGYFSICYKNFLNERNKKTAKFFKVLNEVPTILFVVIVIMVIIKPFD